jgi:hypothetical protein
MRLTIRQLFKLAPLLIVIVLIVGIAIFYSLNKEAVDNDLAALDLIPKPEKLTELYFNNNANLPSSVTGNQAISFAFVIHNLETADYQYTYDVSVTANGIKRIIDSSSVLVKNNQYYVKNENFTLMKSSGRQKVMVELTNKQQWIDFWIGE